MPNCKITEEQKYKAVMDLLQCKGTLTEICYRRIFRRNPLFIFYIFLNKDVIYANFSS